MRQDVTEMLTSLVVANPSLQETATEAEINIVTCIQSTTRIPFGSGKAYILKADIQLLFYINVVNAILLLVFLYLLYL